jgi:hypothetical protein
MITRIVLLKLYEEAMKPEALAALVAASKTRLAAVPGVTGVSVSQAADDASSQSWDLCLMIRFAHAADVEPYRIHPLHIAYVEDVLAPATSFKKAWNFESVE